MHHQLIIALWYISYFYHYVSNVYSGVLCFSEFYSFKLSSLVEQLSFEDSIGICVCFWSWSICQSLNSQISVLHGVPNMSKDMFGRSVVHQGRYQWCLADASFANPSSLTYMMRVATEMIENCILEQILVVLVFVGKDVSMMFTYLLLLTAFAEVMIIHQDLWDTVSSIVTLFLTHF